MQCRVCGAPIPPGANACPSCGSAVPASSDNQQGQLPPTAYAGPTPPTNYGSTPVPPPPSYGGGPYQSGQPSSSPYNQNYSSAPYNQPGQQYPPYNQPANNFQQGGGYPGAPGPQPPYSPPPRKKSRVGLIIGIVALLLVVACIASVVFASKLPGVSQTDSTPTAVATKTPVGVTPTPTTGSTTQANSTPSGNPIDPQAASIIIHPQTASEVDKDTLEPKAGTVGTTFKINQPIYVTFHLDPSKYDITKEQDWVNVRFYRGSESILKDDPLQLTKQETVGYFGAKYYLSTTNGAAEIYWCHTSTCSDGKLAQVVHFTVTD
ncbi:zinc ribbon domain-containing protein [Dictyobacter aurantiacus]|uniref:zinc ribbon domain-containing protein n=1 Tax=Dictyobacter aurantiacus TaxID=1936993 RepID=UPI000F82174C|nr:zinc ribbon domain-containing protein [Dictyobacter aurantiacus]